MTKPASQTLPYDLSQDDESVGKAHPRASAAAPHRQQDRGNTDDADTPMRGFRTEAQQAELLGKHVRTLRRWRRLRIGPAWTNNGIGVLYNDDWTRTWLEGGKVEMPRTLSTSKRWRGRRGAT